MPVVSDTSPLSNLAIIGRLSLLRDCFEVVFVPDHVWRELGQLTHAKPQASLMEARGQNWLRVQTIQHTSLANILNRHLDRGESEAIALAFELSANWLVIDEREGRSVARQSGLQVIGVLGILAKARRAGTVNSLKHEIESLRREARFFIGKELESDLLRSVGE